MRLNVAVEIPIFSATDLAGALNKKFSSIIKFNYRLYLNIGSQGLSHYFRFKLTISQSFFFIEVLGAMSSSLASSSSGSATESILFGSLAFVKASAFFAAITAYPPIFVLFFFLFLLSVLVFTSPVQQKMLI